MRLPALHKLMELLSQLPRLTEQLVPDEDLQAAKKELDKTEILVEACYRAETAHDWMDTVDLMVEAMEEFEYDVPDSTDTNITSKGSSVSGGCNNSEELIPD